MAIAKLPTAQPVLADFFGEILGIPKNEFTANGAITAGAAVPFSLVVNEAIDTGVATVGKLTTSNGEVLNYNAVNTGTKTFTVNARAQEGTTAAAIDAGSAVGQYLTRDQVNQLIQELIQMSKTGAGAKGADVASAAALNIGSDGWYFHVTGTTTITSIAARLAGQVITLHFTGALTLTHNATSLILQGGTNVTTAAGDVFTFVSEGSGNWREKSRRLATSSVAGDMVRIEEKVLAVDTASFDFTSIPATYNHLLIEVQVRGAVAATLVEFWLRFNGDVGANYDWQHLQGNATAVAGGESFAQTKIRALAGVAGATSTAGVADIATIRIPNYRRTTFQKSAITNGGLKRGTATGDLYSQQSVGWWRSTAAITQVTILPDSGNWLAGSVAVLYGLK